MTAPFMIRDIATVTPPKGLAAKRQAFGFMVQLGGIKYELVFGWNGIHEYYALNILGPFGRIRKLYPRVGEVNLLRLINASSDLSPDARVIITRLDGSLEDLRPETFDKAGVRIVFAIGAEIKISGGNR